MEFDKELLKKVGGTLKELRNEKRYRAQDVAKKLGCGVQTVFNFEAGKIGNFETFIKMCYLYDVEANAILYWHGI